MVKGPIFLSITENVHIINTGNMNIYIYTHLYTFIYLYIYMLVKIDQPQLITCSTGQVLQNNGPTVGALNAESPPQNVPTKNEE